MTGIYSFKAKLTLLSTLSGLFAYLYFKEMFQANFNIMTYFEYFERKQQICCQSVIFNAVWMHCVKYESALCLNLDKWYTK